MNCRMLHLRTSGGELERTSKEFYVTRGELHTFAEWAFGPDGMRELDVIAYGDFSFPELHRDDNALLCRGNTANGSATFQTLKSSSGPLWDWVQSHMDALGSCASPTPIEHKRLRGNESQRQRRTGCLLSLVLE